MRAARDKDATRKSNTGLDQQLMCPDMRRLESDKGHYVIQCQPYLISLTAQHSGVRKTKNVDCIFAILYQLSK